MNINNLTNAVIRGLCLGFIILSIIVNLATILRPDSFSWDVYIVLNSLNLICVSVGVWNEVQMRGLDLRTVKEEVIHGVEHILHFFGWLGSGVGFLSAIATYTPWVSKDYFLVLSFGGVSLLLLGVFLLHISWNLRRNFRRIIPD